ncbi:MAG: hypothetical protein LIP02_07240 [Bacteroidales bacterium]|nr:hypothetical protein [Bacteroidales bacterium]
MQSVARAQAAYTAQVKAENGYQTITTFWGDFHIADAFGAKAVRDTYRRAMAYAKTDYKAMTELVLVLNHRIWFHYGRGDQKMTALYDELWRKAQSWGRTHLKGEEFAYFYNTLD